jgi:uncharacterized protein involved in exopolysaccharide biosynthesis
MNIIQFIRLLQKNLLTLIIVPLILALLVYFLTRNEKKIYSSFTVIYTGIASGYNIESKGNDKIDFFATNNAFDNLINIIKSRETLEKAAVMLLAQNLVLTRPNPVYISEKSYNELQEIVPDEVKRLVNRNNVEETYNNLMKLKNKDEKNFVYQLLNYGHPHYSIKALSAINVRRVQSSDLVEISYSKDDPGICMQTLILITKYFTENYRQLKEVQTDDVVKYFEEQVARTSNSLKASEDELLNFNKDNKIINYYEQTKYIASRKEELDVDIQKVQMSYAASIAALNEVEKKLTDKDKIYLKSEEILRKRNKLATINSRISLTEMYSENKATDNIKLEHIKQDAEQIQKQLEDDLTQLYLYGHSREGVPLKDLLSQWLINSIKKEESKATLDVLNKRRAEFSNVYTIFAPLGATLKRIERKIGVTENEYLELLHSLTLAKLKQQNVQLSSALKVVDPPFFPINAKASKRKLLIVASALFGFVLVLIVIILMEYFDNTIKTPERAEALFKLKLAGLLPLMIKKKTKKVNMDFIINRTIELISQSIKLDLLKSNNNVNPDKTYLITVFSTRKNDGKTTFIEHLAEKFREYGENTLFLNYCHPSDFHNYNIINEHTDNKCYQLLNNFFEIKNFQNLLLDNQINLSKKYKYIFLELPPLILYTYPSDLVREADLSLMVCRSNRAWNKADDGVLNVYKEISNNKILSILNGVELYLMENVIGEIPKKRSWLRRMIKKLLKLQFYERYSVK